MFAMAAHKSTGVLEILSWNPWLKSQAAESAGWKQLMATPFSLSKAKQIGKGRRNFLFSAWRSYLYCPRNYESHREIRVYSSWPHWMATFNFRLTQDNSPAMPEKSGQSMSNLQDSNVDRFSVPKEFGSLWDRWEGYTSAWCDFVPWSRMARNFKYLKFRAPWATRATALEIYNTLVLLVKSGGSISESLRQFPSVYAIWKQGVFIVMPSAMDSKL